VRVSVHTDALTPVRPDLFRKVLGQFCTGVTVVTGVDGGEPVGFACQAFAALSLEPPLVLCCPGRRSTSWRRIARAGRFCVNVLAEGQRELSRVFGISGADKFAGVRWSPSPAGAPILDGVLTWIDCAVETVHEAGDHHVVIGRVRTLGPYRDGRPLLFFRGRYTGTAPSAPDGPPEVVDTLLAWPRHTDWM
jgi:3-hydroxy-9,10-secoandrosta-1,3,5(10)-triene-9,17-dione monooxygenase reductase component